MSLMELSRKQNENNFEYQKRLVYGKLVDKTLADIDYTELAEALYGQSYAPDVARRMVYGSRRTLDALEVDIKNGAVDMSKLADLDAKRIELFKERQRFFDQRREYAKVLSKDARYEHILDRLCDCANRLSETVGCIYDGSVSPPIEFDETEGVLVLSDWHYGLKTENVFNKYSTDICSSRVQSVTTQVIKKLLLHRCRRLHIVVLGDLIHGAIHTSARVASEELVCDQLMQASEILAQTVEILSSYVGETIVYVTYGNHARTVQNKGDSIHRDNLERLVPWWLQQRLAAHENILVQEDSGTEFLLLDVCGHHLCASHGDNDTVKTSSRLLPMLLNQKFGTNIEYVLLGDKHHRESFEELGVTSVLCGALCGTDDYANGKRLYSTPSQLLLIMNEADGVDAEYQIKCR